MCLLAVFSFTDADCESCLTAARGMEKNFSACLRARKNKLKQILFPVSGFLLSCVKLDLL